MAATREALLARPDVPDEDIDDIVGIAAELQDADRPRDRVSVDEVIAVAGELDLEPRYVEQAIEVLRSRREQALDGARKEELQASERRRRKGIVGLTIGAAVAILAAGQVVVVRSAAEDLRAAAANLEHSAGYVEVVLDRQASLVPQLVALAGGDPAPLEDVVRRMHGGELEARLAASRDLDLALASVLAELPPPRDDTEGVQRLGLQHEVAGVQNRRSVEVRRLEDARRAWAHAERQRGAGLALAIGLAAPPEI